MPRPPAPRRSEARAAGIARQNVRCPGRRVAVRERPDSQAPSPSPRIPPIPGDADGTTSPAGSLLDRPPARAPAPHLAVSNSERTSKLTERGRDVDDDVVESCRGCARFGDELVTGRWFGAVFSFFLDR